MTICGRDNKYMYVFLDLCTYIHIIWKEDTRVTSSSSITVNSYWKLKKNLGDEEWVKQVKEIKRNKLPVIKEVRDDDAMYRMATTVTVQHGDCIAYLKVVKITDLKSSQTRKKNSVTMYGYGC